MLQLVILIKECWGGGMGKSPKNPPLLMIDLQLRLEWAGPGREAAPFLPCYPMGNNTSRVAVTILYILFSATSASRSDDC